MCPVNPIGTVDLYMSPTAGSSGSEAHASAACAVMSNGTRKGAAPAAMQIMRSSPGLEDIWQLHWSYTAGVEQNSAGVFIANLEEPATLAAVLGGTSRGGGPAAAAHAPAHAIRISAESTGTFTVTNHADGLQQDCTRNARSSSAARVTSPRSAIEDFRGKHRLVHSDELAQAVLRKTYVNAWRRSPT